MINGDSFTVNMWITVKRHEEVPDIVVAGKARDTEVD